MRDLLWKFLIQHLLHLFYYEHEGFDYSLTLIRSPALPAIVIFGTFRYLLCDPSEPPSLTDSTTLSEAPVSLVMRCTTTLTVSPGRYFSRVLNRSASLLMSARHTKTYQSPSYKL